MKACYCYAAVEESWTGRVFSIKLSSGFKSSVPFESPRKDCQPSTYRLPQRVSLVFRCAVGIQTMSLNGNPSIESMAAIVCRRSNTVFTFERHHIVSSLCYLWSAARVRTWAFVIYYLHSRHRHHRAVIWSQTPQLRQR